MERKRYVIIMAAGSGTRMGAEKPKQFIELEGKAILQRTIEVFKDAYPDISVVTVLPEQHIEYWKDYCYRKSFVCPQILVKGGITRFHSVKNALKKVPDGAVVAVHDGVRPFVSVDLVRRLFDEAESAVSAIPVLPCVDTMKVLSKTTDNQGREVLAAVPGASVDRSVLFGAQTPQVFHSEVLKQAYEQAFDTAFTDDASVVEKYGKNLSYLIGERFNIKITTRDDLIIAGAVMSMLGKN
jgi:2-C-methyl-D-erythritol 4-phosphate cytidylyltransferase